MKITIYENGEVFTPDKLIGFVGETNYRSIDFEQPAISGADSCKLRLLYKDGLIYEIPISNGTAQLDGSVLREAGRIQGQWVAYSTNSITGEYTLVAKSQMFELKIGESIGDDVAEIPTYEAIMAAAEQLVEDGMTKEEVITAIQQIIETGEVHDLDTGFVTTLKEIAHGLGFRVWLGTTAEFNALQASDLLEANVLYIRTDDTSAQDIRSAIAALQSAVAALQTAAADSGWQTLTISSTQGGFSAPTSGNKIPSYRKIGNHVYIQGFVMVNMGEAGPPDVNSPFAQLPSEFVPSHFFYLHAPGQGAREAGVLVDQAGCLSMAYFKDCTGANVTSGEYWFQIDCDFLTD